MPNPQPPRTFGVSSFSIYAHSQMISSGFMPFNNKLFPNLCLQPRPPLGNLRWGQMFYANPCLYKQFESPKISLSAPFWWPSSHDPEKERSCWAMEWSSWDNPIIGALTFPTVPGTRGALRKVEETQSKVQGPRGLLGLVERNTDPSPKLCSKFQTRWHTTVHQSKHWHVYIFSFLNNVYHIYIHLVCLSVSLLSSAGYHCKML